MGGLKDILKTFKDNKVLIPVLDRHLLSLNDSREPDGWIHPSGITNCTREIFYEMKKITTPDEISPQLRRIFDNGHHVHMRIQKWLLEAGVTKPSETSKYGEHRFEKKEFRVRGTCDGIIKDGPRILEIKSINRNQFGVLQGPKTEHLWQGHIYMWGLGIQEIVFLYECKDDQSMKEFVVKFDAEIFNTIFERIKYLNECFEKNTVPARWVCGECVWCKKRAKGDKK